jgi:ENT domain
MDYRKEIRRLESEAYSAVVSAFRAQGELTWRKEQILAALRGVLHVCAAEHESEQARVASDPRLAKLAKKRLGAFAAAWQMSEQGVSGKHKNKSIFDDALAIDLSEMSASISKNDDDNGSGTESDEEGLRRHADMLDGPKLSAYPFPPSGVEPAELGRLRAQLGKPVRGRPKPSAAKLKRERSESVDTSSSSSPSKQKNVKKGASQPAVKRQRTATGSSKREAPVAKLSKRMPPLAAGAPASLLKTTMAAKVTTSNHVTSTTSTESVTQQPTSTATISENATQQPTTTTDNAMATTISATKTDNTMTTATMTKTTNGSTLSNADRLAAVEAALFDRSK